MFKELYSFSKPEIDAAFKAALLLNKTEGIKLLQTPAHILRSFETTASQSPQDGRAFGKFLIITPRSCGKAHERNLIRRRLKAIYFEQKLYQKRVTTIALIYSGAMKLSFDHLKAFILESFAK